MNYLLRGILIGLLFGLPVGGDAGWAQGSLLVCGVFIGTYLWWGALTGFAGIVKKKAKRFRFRQLNLIFGGILCIFGLAVFLRTFFL